METKTAKAGVAPEVTRRTSREEQLLTDVSKLQKRDVELEGQLQYLSQENPRINARMNQIQTANNSELAQQLQTSKIKLGSGSQSAQWRHRIATASSGCASCTGFGYSMDTEFTVQKQDCTRYDVKFAAVRSSRKQAWSHLH